MLRKIMAWMRKSISTNNISAQDYTAERCKGMILFFVNLSAEYGVQRFTGLVADQWTLEESDQAALMGNH